MQPSQASLFDARDSCDTIVYATTSAVSIGSSNDTDSRRSSSLYHNSDSDADGASGHFEEADSGQALTQEAYLRRSEQHHRPAKCMMSEPSTILRSKRSRSEDEAKIHGKADDEEKTPFIGQKPKPYGAATFASQSSHCLGTSNVRMARVSAVDAESLEYVNDISILSRMPSCRAMAARKKSIRESISLKRQSIQSRRGSEKTQIGSVTSRSRRVLQKSLYGTPKIWTREHS